MSVNNTVAKTRSSATSACSPVRNSAISETTRATVPRSDTRCARAAQRNCAPCMRSAMYLGRNERDELVVGVVKDESRRADRRQQRARTSNSKKRGNRRPTVRGLADRVHVAPNTVSAHAILPTVRVPTLVLHHSDDPIVPPEMGKDVADHIEGAKFVELPGRNLYHFVEPWRASFKRLPSSSPGTRPTSADERVLATVLFTDIVDSTRCAAEMGDRDWRALLDAHDAVVRSQLARFRGREVNTAGDGFLAMFDGPQRAIRCAMAIRDAVQALGIEVRAGLHTGECEVRGDDIGGIAVHIGARVERAGRAERGAGVQHAARSGDRVRAGVRGRAARTSSRACPASGGSSPSHLRSGGFRRKLSLPAVSACALRKASCRRTFRLTRPSSPSSLSAIRRASQPSPPAQ